MSDLQISTTLATLSTTLQSLSLSLEDEKHKHIQLLKKLSEFLSNSSETALSELTSFLKAINVDELATIVTNSKNICEQQQESIGVLSKKVIQLSSQLDESIQKLDEQSTLVIANVESNVQSIQAQIVELVSENLKKKIIENFNSLFLEEQNNLSAKVKKINETTVNRLVDVYKVLLSEANKIQTNHISALDGFEKSVSEFNSQLVQSVENIEKSFSDVEEITKKNMSKLYESCFNFQDEVIKKINLEVEGLNDFFTKKMEKTISLVEGNFDKTYQKFEELDQKLTKKHDETVKNLEKNCEASLGLTQKTIEKQEILFKNLSNKLNFKYFSINSSCIIFVLLTVLSALCITTFVKNQQLNEENQQLEEKNKRLHQESILLQVVKKDTVDLTKLAINDLKKKFPDLEMTLNCKALD